MPHIALYSEPGGKRLVALALAAMTGLVIALAARTEPVREQPGAAPRVTIESATGSPAFGTVLAAEGPWIAAIDHERVGPRRGRQLLRIGRIDGDRVVEGAPFYDVAGSAMDFAGDTLAVRSGADLVVLYGRESGDRWAEQQRLRLPQRCAGGPHDVSLGVATLTVDGRSTTCVFSRGATGWRFDARIDGRANGTQYSAVSGDAVLVLRGDQVDIHERTSAGWRSSKRLSLPPSGDHSFVEIAAGGQWCVVETYSSTSAPKLLVFDLSRLELVATLDSQVQGATDFYWDGLAVGASTIAVTTFRQSRESSVEHWELVGQTWRHAGVLDVKKPRAVGVGDLIWVGAPYPDRRHCGGTIQGFASTDPG